MPSFCRHNRLIQNCPICSREQAVEMRPVVNPGAPRANTSRPATDARQHSGDQRSTTAPRSRSASRGGSRRAGGDLRVRRLVRGVDDGYDCRLVPGLRSSGDAERLADEVAFASHRLDVLQSRPPGLYAEVAGEGDVEERTWLAFLIAYLCPLNSEDPFAAIQAVRTPWSTGELPDLTGVQTGPRTAHDPERGNATLLAYRAWARRAGSQQAAFTGETSWTPERRFDRVFERLALPGMHRDARYDLLVALGRLGVYELGAARLHLIGANEATVAAKRAFGIGDLLLLERRASELAAACEVPIESLDLALDNWGTGRRALIGLTPESEPDQAVVERCRAALGL